MRRISLAVVGLLVLATSCAEADDGSSALEQAFFDGMSEEGVARTTARCVLRELQSDGYGPTDLAIAGMYSADPSPSTLGAMERCGLSQPPQGDDDCEGDTTCGQPTTVTGGAYGDDPFLDALHDDCAAGDMQACDDLYWQSPIGSQYEAFGNTCGDTVTPAPLSCTSASTPSESTPEPEPLEYDAYGDDPFLDALHDDCAAGDMQACDDLYWSSPIGSEYEAFGNTCGDTVTPAPLSCVSDGVDFGPKADDYGDDPILDALHDDCAAGDMQACDDLWWQSPIGSQYEAFGDTCGNTVTASLETCTGDPYPFDTEPEVYGDDPFLDALHDDCAAGDMRACDDLYWSSPIGSEYEAFGDTCGDTVMSGQFGRCEEESG